MLMAGYSLRGQALSPSSLACCGALGLGRPANGQVHKLQQPAPPTPVSTSNALRPLPFCPLSAHAPLAPKRNFSGPCPLPLFSRASPPASCPGLSSEPPVLPIPEQRAPAAPTQPLCLALGDCALVPRPPAGCFTPPLQLPRIRNLGPPRPTPFSVNIQPHRPSCSRSFKWHFAFCGSRFGGAVHPWTPESPYSCPPHTSTGMSGRCVKADTPDTGS